MTSADKEGQPSKQRERSPSFPFVSLRTAVERLIAFENKFGRHPVPALKAGLAWGMKPESSQAGQTLAALKAFGMVDYTGQGSARAAVLTEEARNFLRAQQQAIKGHILKGWAVRPKNIHKYFMLWGRGRPIDEICLDELVLRGEFTEAAAKTFLRVYDDTLAYAGLSDDDRGAAETDEAAADEVAGVVESSPFPLQYKEVPMTAQPVVSQPVIPQRGAMKQDIFTLEEGVAVLQWPSQLSESSYEDFKDWIELQLRKIKKSVQ